MIIRYRTGGVFNGFEVAARFDVDENFPEKVIPVRNTAKKFAGMNEVEVVFRISPWKVEIVNLKGAIGRDKVRLDWGEVVSSDNGRWILVGHISEWERLVSWEALSFRISG